MIWKFNNHPTKNNIFICEYCRKYIDVKFSRLFKHLIHVDINNIKPVYNTYTYKIEYPKCFICDRYIHNILNGPDLLSILSSSSNINDICQTLSKLSVVYYNDINDNIGHNIIDDYNFSHQDMKNIYSSIKNIEGLPSTTIINDKASYITSLVHDNY